MTYEEYRYLSLKRQTQIMMVADWNTIIDKLTIWQNKGKDNPVWEKMPTITAGEGKENIIFDDVPYAIGLSEYTSSLVSELASKKVQNNSEGYSCPIDIVDTEILPTLSITTQFGLLEYYEVETYRIALEKGKLFNIDTDKFLLKDITRKGLDVMVAGSVKALSDNYSLKGVAKRFTTHWNAIGIEPLSDDAWDLYVQLAERRNELTHEISYKAPTLIEAKKYFEDCNKIALRIRVSFANL